jgi:hypothetical protein
MSDGKDKLRLVRVVEFARPMIRLMDENDRKSLAIFAHCSGGSISSHEDSFIRDVGPVLKLHGIEYEIVNQGGG